MKINRSNLFNRILIPIREYLLIMKLTIILISLGLYTFASKTNSQATRPSFEVNNATIDAQADKKITGKVTDSSGASLPGVSIVVRGTTIGTVTDVDGQFNLKVPIEAKSLVFSFIGMMTQEIAIASKTVFNIILQEQTVGLEEVVAVGYGVQKKESIVGAISQTTNEQLKRTGNVTDLKQALTGQLPGVTTITSSGQPGGTGRGESATSIFIRGQNTWNGGQPLILVDGTEREMNNLDVSEVESISVLKDASATAVFGVKGANGVILISTKRGTMGKPKLSFTYSTTAAILSKVPKKLDSYNAIMLRNEAIERESVINGPSWLDYIPYEIAKRYKLPQTPEYAQIYPNVDWEKALFKDLGISHHATLNIQGGTDFVKYFGSFSYLHEGDMFKKYENNKGYDPNYNYDRFNFRSNLDFKLTKTTNLKVNLSGYFGQRNTSYADKTNGKDVLLWGAIYGMEPDAYLPQYPDGSWGYSPISLNHQNPVGLVYNNGIWTNRITQLNSDFSLEQKLDFITPGLSAGVSLFYDNNIISQSVLYDQGGMDPNNGNTAIKYINPLLYTGPDQDPSVYTTNYPISTALLNGFDWAVLPWSLQQELISPAAFADWIPITRKMMYQFQMNYARKFNLHNIGAMGLVKREEYALGSMFKKYREDWVFRATYDYNTKYLFEMNGAYNGSEQFGPGYRFAFFPSLALGWYVSNEKFFKVDWINKLKIRYSSGMVGDDNVTGGGRWLYESQLSYGGTAHIGQNPQANSPYLQYKESVVGNSDIHWEKARKDNFGVEIGLFKNLISATFEYFTEDRTDVLMTGSSRNMPPFFGTTPPSANLGRVKSRGHEIELKFDKRMSSGVHYWAALALAHTQNEILEKDDPVLMDAYQQSKGFSINQPRSTVRAGFYNNWDDVFASVPTETNDLAKLPGFYNLLDFNTDGNITAADNIPIGYSQVPQNTCNLSLGTDYKGFSINVQFYGVTNATRYIPLQNFQYNADIIFEHALDYWSKDNQDATSFLPRWKTQGKNIGEYFFYDASYLRLKTAEIAYTFHDKLLKNAGLSALKIFLNGNNLIFWSKLPDDREGSFSGDSQGSGAYPTVKRINLGIDLTF